MWKNLKSWLKRNVALSITFAFAVITFIFWVVSVDTIDFSDLWLNLLAGFIASICTILVIDNALKKKKEIEDKPFKLAMYREIQIFTSRFVYLWRDMYVQSNTDRKEVSLEEFFTPKYIEPIYNNLDLEGEPNVVPKQTWFTYLDGEMKDLVHRGNTILNRYVAYAEPELFQAIYHLVNDSSFINMFVNMKMIRNVDKVNNIPRHTLLCCYVPMPNGDDYKALRVLLGWCKKYYEELKEAGTVYKIPDNMGIEKHKDEPKSRMSEEKINNQNLIWAKWSKEYSNN